MPCSNLLRSNIQNLSARLLGIMKQAQANLFFQSKEVVVSVGCICHRRFSWLKAIHGLRVTYTPTAFPSVPDYQPSWLMMMNHALAD